MELKFNHSITSLAQEIVETWLTPTTIVCPWCGKGCAEFTETHIVCGCGIENSAALFFAKVMGCETEDAEKFLLDRQHGYWTAETNPQKPKRKTKTSQKKPSRLQQSFALFGAQASGFAAYLRVRRSREANGAYRWLSSRGFTQKDLERFRIGVFPFKYYLNTYEARQAFGFLRGRITIPLADEQGRTAGFIGRKIDGVDPTWSDGKYVCSKSTQNFSKGTNLHLLHEAREAIAEKGWLCITEGYLDAPALHIAGLTNSCAIGTRLITEQQIEQVKELNVPVVIALDSDTAGETGGDQVETKLSEQGIKTARYRWQAKDANEYLRKWMSSWRETEAPLQKLKAIGEALT